MLSRLLFSILAIATPLALATDLPKPLTLTFLATEEKGQIEWSDSTDYADKPAKGTTPHQDDKRYLGHLTYKSSDDFNERYFGYRATADDDWIPCTAIINGDPNTGDLTYDPFKRVFVSDGPPDLSVVHVRCFHDQKLPIVKPSNGLTNVSRPTASKLSDTDFEHLVYIDLKLTNVMATLEFGREPKWDEAPTEDERGLEGGLKDLISAPNGTITSNKDFIHSFAFLRPSTRNVSFLPGENKPRLSCDITVHSDPHFPQTVINLDAVVTHGVDTLRFENRDPFNDNTYYGTGSHDPILMVCNNV